MAASPLSSLNRNRAFRGKRLRGSPVSMARIFGGSVTSIYSPEPSAMSQVYFLPSCCNIAFIGRPPIFSNDSGPTKVHQEKFPDYLPTLILRGRPPLAVVSELANQPESGKTRT